MPRKPPKLSLEDLDAIISGEWVDGLIDWARDEKERRAKAGKGGGRPKKRDFDVEPPTIREELAAVPTVDIPVIAPKVWQWFGGARLKNGIWIRNQLCGKETRTVEVDADDHDKILRVLQDDSGK